MRMPAPAIQRKCASCTAAGKTCAKCAEEKNLVQRKTTPASNGTDLAASENFLSDLGSGQPLDSQSRAFFEPRFGHDFSRVRVHTDTNAAESARAVNALAYTLGQNVIFDAGKYQPQTVSGRQLLAHELTHAIQQGSARAKIALAAASPIKRHSVAVRRRTTGMMFQRAPISKDLRSRIELCIKPFYYDKKGNYNWSLEPKPDCSDIKIPADRERAWKCVDPFYWSDDGKKWTWSLDPEPDCSDVRLPVPLHEARAEPPEVLASVAEAERLRKIVEKNRVRIEAIRDAAPHDVEALARMFTDKKITDDGTVVGRVNAIFEATAHDVIPGLQTGIEFGQSGFRKEFLDPWPSSENQVGHFLTAVRLAFDPGVVEYNPFVLAILDAWWDSEIPLRLIIGHEKEPDPGVFDISVGFEAQYRATTDEDIKNFKAGKLDAIKVGKGRGNSMADLKLSYKGWILGRWIAEGRFKSGKEIADWIRNALAAGKK